jgi:hypothetical protein
MTSLTSRPFVPIEQTMGRIIEEQESWDGEEWEDDDYDCDGNDDEPTVPCPYCRREIFEDSPRCPHCGQYISAEDSPPGRKPWWIVVGVLLCLAAIWVWFVIR